MSFFDIVIPETSTNLVLNPSAGTTGNLTAIGGGTVSRVTTYSYFGNGCHRIQASADNTGGYFTIAAAANAIHYVTLRINSASDISTFDVSMDNSNWNDMTLLSTEGSWWVYGVSIPAVQASGSVALRIQQKGAGSIDLYIGHVQVEEKTYATTPVTGDLPGCYWKGTAHASASVRKADTRSGGRVYDLATQYGLYMLDLQNIGASEVTRYATDLAQMPGSIDGGHKVQTRDMLLVGELNGTTWENMHSKRKALLSVLSADYVAGDQPVTLRYRGALSTKPLEISAYYRGGMEFTDYAGFTSRQALKLRANDPYWYDVHESSTTLTVSSTITTAGYAVKKVDGVWSNISTNFNGTIVAFAKLPDGQVLIGGGFTNIGDGNGDKIVKYNPITGAFTSLGTGMDNTVYAIAVAPDGTFYAGGAFTSAGGVANTDGIAKWNGSAWTAIAGGMTITQVNAIVIGQDGMVYVGGDFTNADGNANADYIFKYDPVADTIAALGTGMNGIVYALAIAPNGDLYAGGFFTTAGGTTVNGVAKWNGSAWSALGTGLAGIDSASFALAIDKTGLIYVGGSFTSANTVPCVRITKWNGTNFEALGSGADNSVRALSIDDTGLLYMTGQFATVGGLTLTDRTAVWNGSSWSRLDIDLPGAGIVYAVLSDIDSLYLGYSTTGAAVSSAITTVANGGTARAYPKLIINRSGGTSAVVEWLRNETTDATIYLNYSLLNGETLTLDFNPQGQECKSSFFGDVWRGVLRGSDFADFYLQPGANSISTFVNTTGSPTMTAYLVWRNAYDGVDGGAA